MSANSKQFHTITLPKLVVATPESAERVAEFLAHRLDEFGEMLAQDVRRCEGGASSSVTMGGGACFETVRELAVVLKPQREPPDDVYPGYLRTDGDLE